MNSGKVSFVYAGNKTSVLESGTQAGIKAWGGLCTIPVDYRLSKHKCRVTGVRSPASHFYNWHRTTAATKLVP